MRAVDAPSGIGAAYSEAAITGSQLAAFSDNRRYEAASLGEYLAISALVRARSRYIARVSPSSNIELMGDSGNTYRRPYFDLSPSSSFKSRGLPWVKMGVMECWSCRNPGTVSSRVTTPPPNQALRSSTSTRLP